MRFAWCVIGLHGIESVVRGKMDFVGLRLVSVVAMTFTPIYSGSDRSDSLAPEDYEAHHPLDLAGSITECLLCGADLTGSALFELLHVCDVCRFHYNLPVRKRIASLVDGDSFVETHKWIQSLDPLEFSPRISYRVRLLRDQERTGLTEAAIVGTGSIGGTECGIVAIDFGFLGGSMGLVVGEKVARLFELAAARRLPVVSMISSGGARIQEGVLSLNQMAKTVVAARGLHRQRMPLISVLANPSSGQILSSFASISDVKIGEPGALIGFAPSGTLKQVEYELDGTGQECDAETMLAHGHLDRVVDREFHRGEIPELLRLLVESKYRLGARFFVSDRSFEPSRSDSWHSVQLARKPDRPTSRDFIRHGLRSFIELHGDRVNADDPSVVAGLGRLGGLPVAVVGQERSYGVQRDDDDGGNVDGDDDANQSPLISFTEAFGDAEYDRGGVPVSGFRKAQRVAKLAERFRMPLVMLVDAPGPALGIEQELSGLAESVSEMIDLMLGLRTPIVSVLLGECGGESALAFGLADRVLMLEHSVYTPISPEWGAETELMDRLRAPEVARSLRLTALDAVRMGLVDRSVREPEGGAHLDAALAGRYVRRALMSELGPLTKVSRRTLVRRRELKYRRVGEYGPEFRAAVRRELRALRGSLGDRLRSVFGRRGRPSDGDSVRESD